MSKSIVRSPLPLLSIFLCCVALPVAAQVTLDRPLDEPVPFYLDDPSQAVVAELISATVIVGTPISGGLPELGLNEGEYFVVDSVTQGARNNTMTVVEAQLPFAPVTTLGLVVVFGPANASPVFLSVQLFNYDTQAFDVLEFGIASQSTGTLVHFAGVTSPNDYVNEQGQIQLRVGQTAREPQTPGGFTKLIDWVRIVGYKPVR